MVGFVVVGEGVWGGFVYFDAKLNEEHPPVTSPPPPTVRPPRNKKGGPQVHARRPPCYPIIKPMGIEHNQINPSPSYFLTEMANPPLLAHLICNLVSQFTFWFSIT